VLPRETTMEHVRTGGCATSPNTTHPPLTELKILTNEYLRNPKISIHDQSGKEIKQRRMLLVLCVFSKHGYRLTRFDAIKFNDTSLNSTIPKLESKLGVTVQREWTTRKTAYETHTRCKGYWLDSEQLEKAENMLLRKPKATHG